MSDWSFSDWTFSVPGQPPSVNHMYVRVRGQWDKMAKARGVEAYQTTVALLCKSARPSGWTPSPQIRLQLRFHLGKDADCDNLLKVLQDAIAQALGINDRAFLPCVVEKSIGNRNPWTEVTITNLPSPSSGLEG